VGERDEAAREQEVVRCLTCGYDVRGLGASRCPECGAALTSLDAWIAAERADFEASSWHVVRIRLITLAVYVGGVFAWYLLAVPKADILPVLFAIGWLLLTSLPALFLAHRGTRDISRLLGLLWLRGLPLLHGGWLTTWLIIAGSNRVMSAGRLPQTQSGGVDFLHSVRVVSVLAMGFSLVLCMVLWASSTHTRNASLRFERDGVPELGFSMYLVLGMIVLLASAGWCAIGLFPEIPTV